MSEWAASLVESNWFTWSQVYAFAVIVPLLVVLVAVYVVLDIRDRRKK